jgi:hypothetical protein
MPSIEIIGDAAEWDRAEGDGLVGNSILVGMMFLAAGRATARVDPNSAIAWQGVGSSGVRSAKSSKIGTKIRTRMRTCPPPGQSNHPWATS